MRVWGIVAIALLVAVGGCERIPGTDQHVIAKGKTAAGDLLIDPSSAQFRRVELRKVPGAKSDDPIRRVVCGEVNGKNRSAAYVGFSRFVANPDNGDVLLEPSDVASDQEAAMARRRCEAGSKEPLYSETERELRVMACNRAIEIHEVRVEAAEFAAVHKMYCEDVVSPHRELGQPASE